MINNQNLHKIVKKRLPAPLKSIKRRERRKINFLQSARIDKNAFIFESRQ